MDEIRVTTAQPVANKYNELSREIASAAQIIQAFIAHPEDSTDALQSVPSVLLQAGEKLRQWEAQFQQIDTKPTTTHQPLIRGASEMQNLLDILPVGILIGHDPQNYHMTVNQAGMKILNLIAGTNPSKSGPGAEELPFKILRDGKELLPEELPMQYATTHQVALRDIELDVLYSDGRLLNLLEYAAPLFDEQGAVSGSLGVLVDITARKAAEQQLVTQYRIARALAEAKTINAAASEVLQLICETAGWEYGAFWRVDPASATLINEGVWHSDQEGLSAFAERTRYSVAPLADASLPASVYHTARPLWLSSLDDIHSSAGSKVLEAGLQGAFILPVNSGEKVIAILEFYFSSAPAKGQNLTEMLNVVGHQIGIFWERKLLEEQLAVQVAHQQLLAQTGIALSTTPDLDTRLRNIGHVIVPALADWFSIDIIDKENNITRVAAKHVDPEKEKAVSELQSIRKFDPGKMNNPQIEALRTGKPLLYTDISDSMIRTNIEDPEYVEKIRRLNPKSSIIVPLSTHGRIFGICTFVLSGSRQRYGTSDLALAEDIGHRLSLSLDNAFLYEESQKLNIVLEKRVEERTKQLEAAIAQLTDQMMERKAAEEQVRILNTDLESRIAERTAQLEQVNLDLQKEVREREDASLILSTLLKRTRDLYRISQAIGSVHTPTGLLGLLLSSSSLKDVSRASIAILNRPWVENETPPESCYILSEWNRGLDQARYINHHFTLAEYGVVLPVPYAKPIVISDIQSIQKLPDAAHKRFADLRTHSLIILPLIAGGEWYGLLSLHFNTRRMTSMDDLRHVRGLVDEIAIAVKSIRLLETESNARKEAEAANDLKLKFLAMISHELRTPLTSIKGFTTTLLADDVVWAPEKQIDFLQTINREADKLNDLIEQLLDLSRMEAGVLRISPARLHLNHVIETALAQLQAVTTRHQLILEIPEDLPLVLADRLRTAQVLTNLVGNAVKFSPPQTVIRISAQQTGLMVQVNVADQGPGIPPSDRERVFEAFRQLEVGTGSRVKGAGLGLAICKGIIEAQKGKIWIQDKQPPGTTISLTLPVWEPEKNSKNSRIAKL